MQSQRPSHAAAIACSLLALMLLCTGCASSPAPQQASSTQRAIPTITFPTPTNEPGTPIPTGTSLPAPVARGPLAPAPTNCPVSPALQTMTQNNFGGGFSSPISFQGDAPAWYLGLPPAGGTLQLQAGPDATYPSTKVMWVVGPNLSHPVTLSGHEIHTGAQLIFEIYPSNARPIDSSTPSFYTTQAILDPAAPNRGDTQNSTGHWNIWGIGIIALTAGCYQLDASASSGSWQAIYPIGG